MPHSGLFEHARGALGAQVHGDLRLAQALEVLDAYGEALERPREAAFADAAELPYPKDSIKWSLLTLLGAIAQPAEREPLKAAFVGLAQWQVRAEYEECVFDSSRLRKRIDPLELAREFAAHRTPEDRFNAAARAERGALIEELRRRGFW